MHHVRLTSVTNFARVMILFTVVLSYTLVNGAGNRWTDVNADPYKGTTKDALRAMVPFGLPESSVADVERCFKDKRFQKGEMKRGGSALVMIHGNLKKTPDVTYDWEKFTGLESEDCATGEFLVRRALICNNFLLEKRQQPPMAKVEAEYSLRVNCFRDRPDGHWLKRYEEEQLKPSTIDDTPYFRVFMVVPFREMLRERKDRPIGDCKVRVYFLRTKPTKLEDVKEIENPRRESVVRSEEILTNKHGFRLLPVPLRLQEFSAVAIIPSKHIPGIVNPVIWINSETFARQLNPLNVWVVQGDE